MKSAFLLSKGLLCLYDKQNNTWLLVDMEFLFLCYCHLYARPCILYFSHLVYMRYVFEVWVRNDTAILFDV